MKRTDFFKKIIDLFCFKILKDKDNNEYVVFSNSPIDELGKVEDKTEFEAIENHVHILDNIKENEFDELLLIANDLGHIFHQVLKNNFPDKFFYVYISLTLYDSMIIRFHQKWGGEVPYYNLQISDDKDERILLFKG